MLHAHEDAVERYVDCSELRLGDRMALAWLAQHHRLRTGMRVAVVDRHERAGLSFSLPDFFPRTFADLTPAEIEARRLPLWDPGNLWLTAANAFAQCQETGHFEALPDLVSTLLAAIRTLSSPRPRVLIHVLDDANYNFRRNWTRTDAHGLAVALGGAAIDVVILNPVPGTFVGGFERMLAEMLAADLFIGGDTGPSHVFAMLRGGASQIAIFPDMARDQVAYAAEQLRWNLPLPWSSLPFQTHLDVVRLKKRKRLVREAGGWRLQSVGRFDPAQVAALASARLRR